MDTGLETVDLDVLLGNQQLLDQELRHLHSLVSLQLDDLSHLVILDDVTVAGKILLQNLQNLLQVILSGHTLHSGQGLTSVTLLDTDVDVVGGLGIRITSVSKWICG